MCRIADVKRMRSLCSLLQARACACIASLFICSPHVTRTQLYALTAYLQQSLDGGMALKTAEQHNGGMALKPAQQHSPKALLARWEVLGLLVLAKGDLGSLVPCVSQ